MEIARLVVMSASAPRTAQPEGSSTHRMAQPMVTALRTVRMEARSWGAARQRAPQMSGQAVMRDQVQSGRASWASPTAPRELWQGTPGPGTHGCRRSPVLVMWRSQ